MRTTSAVALEDHRARSGKDARRHSSDLGNWQAWLFILPPFALLLGLVLWPILYLVYLSSQKWDGLGTSTFVGFRNYITVLTDSRFWLALQHNVTWAVGALLLPPLVGLSLAILLARVHRVIGRSFFRVVYFLPQMVATAIVAVIWRWIYAPENGPANALLRILGSSWQPQWLADSTLALPALFIAYTWVDNGFSMLIFEAAIQNIDESLFEAAKLDGANWFQEIILILIPGIRQAVTTVLMVTAIWSFQIFDLMYLTTRGGPGDATYVLALDIYSSTFISRQVGRGAAIATLLLLAIVILASLTRLRQSAPEGER